MLSAKRNSLMVSFDVFCCLLFLLLLPYSVTSQNGTVINIGQSLPYSVTSQNGTVINIGQSLTAGNREEPWISPSKDFAIGFHKLDNKDLFIPAIWYYKIQSNTIVWYASPDNPAPKGSKLHLTADRGLALDYPDGREIWKTGGDQAAFGWIQDSGNFQIVSSNSESLWQSFDHPTDTLLPGQKLEPNVVVSSRKRDDDYSRGRFQFRLLSDGNVVLNTINLPSGSTYDAYFWSNTVDNTNKSNAGRQVVFDESGSLYVLRGNNQIVNISSVSVPAQENYIRVTLNFDGVLVLYTYPKNSAGSGLWSSSDTIPDNICINNDIREGLGGGTCGHNSICTLNERKRPECGCPKGFSLEDPTDSYGNCKPDFAQGCDGDETRSGADLYDVEELENTDWPTSDFERIVNYSREDCRSACLNDCLCGAAVFRDRTCWKKKLPLSYGKKDTTDNCVAFVKIKTSNETPKMKRGNYWIVAASLLLGGSVFVNLSLILASCLGFLVINREKLTKPVRNEGVSYTNLHCFTYKELFDATLGFKEELGRGAFGIVYKGFMETGSGNVVAVKKLDRLFRDGDQEFKAEVNVIGQTHHKNLVRLVGYCEEGENRLLVYEFMSNGSLASFLFGDIKPDWSTRTQIAIGIAKGLAYLHEECYTHIIHCDIKPQNILLDDFLTARISDFGLAKLLTLDQSHTSTAIRGTKGYVAPEWFRNTPVTAKVDVYSFGVLLLEILSLRRSVEKDISTMEKVILTDWAYDCYQERMLDVLVENESEAIGDMNTLERFVMVAIWCIQEDPGLRPSMRKVTQMLEGDHEVPVPPCPCPFNNNTTTTN